MDAPLESIDSLIDGFRATEKPRAQFRVGMEHEKFGLDGRTQAPLPYFGERSIEAVFQILVERFDFDPILEGSNTIGLQLSGTSISLEPGGQLELSGAVLPDNHATCRELTEHQDLAHHLADELGISWIGCGHHPFARREDFEWMPKARYRIMSSYLPTRGKRALDMMLRTATVQANLDYESEPDMVRKMRTAMGVTPIVSAIYANASIVEGQVTGWVSERQRIWHEVDPDRTGLLPFVFEEGFGYRAYADWALDVPMFFIRRDGAYLGAVCGTPFRTFLEKGHDGHRATMTDWEDHLTTLFPEVRLKGYLEMRGADCCSRDLNCALPALWKGLLYDDDALDAAWALCADWSFETRQQLLLDVARQGLEARVGGKQVLSLCRELSRISRRSLKSQRALNAAGQDEAHFLDPIDQVLSDGVSPGHTAAMLWEGSFCKNPERLAEHFRF